MQESADGAIRTDQLIQSLGTEIQVDLRQPTALSHGESEVPQRQHRLILLPQNDRRRWCLYDLWLTARNR
jgi:hypothetical protein